MIRCPSCGTLNQDSRRVCTQCGAALPQTRVRCPNCGALNPVGNAFCDKCNTRLVKTDEVIPPQPPASQEESKGGPAVRGISLPVRPSAAEEAPSNAGELPDWLQGLVEEAEAAQGDLPAEDTDEDAGEGIGEYPDWLASLLDEGAGEPEADVQPEADELAFEPEALPDWLSGAETPASPEVEGDQDTGSKDLPDWLTALAGEESGPAETQDLPDWLTAAADQKPDQVAEPESAGELPDWLRGAQGGATPPPETSEAAPLPDWLSALGPEPEPERAPAEQPRRTREERPVRPAKPQEPPAQDQALIFSESELPDWLAEARALTPEEAEPAAAPVAQEPTESEPEEPIELPDWLSSLAGEEGEAEELPEWLTGRAPEAATADLERSGEPAPSEVPPDLSSELPDWLTELAPGTGDEPNASVFTEPPPEGLTERSLPPESPSWLRDVAGYGKDRETPASAPVFVEDEAAEPTEELPAEAAEEPQEPLPSWLRELDLAAEEEPQKKAAYAEEETLARANLPNWLQELAPPQTGFGGEGESALPISGDLAPADIPDWVQALRPEAPPEGKARHDRGPLPTPAEPEGPLEGLPGVLTPFALVDIPAEAKPVVDVAIPDTVRAQAQVWQHLLEQPRSSVRPVAQEGTQSRQAVKVVRLLVAAVVILGVFAAFWVMPQGIQLAQVNPIEIAPGVTTLVDAVNQVQPGDRVVVALEYTPAYAEEMSQVALPILDHLATRQVDVVFVSTLPEGPTLGAALASQVPGLTTTVSYYLPGDANGIAEYLSRNEAQSARQLLVLAAQPQHLRWWIEQNAAATRGGQGSLPMSVGVSAATGRLVTPYLESASIQGWVAGFVQALAYRDASGAGTPGAYRQVLDILMLAQWAVAALLAFGLIYSLAAGRKGAR